MSPYEGLQIMQILAVKMFQVTKKTVFSFSKQNIYCDNVSLNVKQRGDDAYETALA